MRGRGRGEGGVAAGARYTERLFWHVCIHEACSSALAVRAVCDADDDSSLGVRVAREMMGASSLKGRYPMQN